MAKVCVLGTTVRDNLFPDGEDPVGKIIRGGAGPALRGGGGAGIQGRRHAGGPGRRMVAPYTTVMRKIQGRDKIQNILASAQDGKADHGRSRDHALLRQRCG